MSKSDEKGKAPSAKRGQSENLNDQELHNLEEAPEILKEKSSPPSPKKKVVGTFGRIKVKKREELGEALIQEIPRHLPSDYHQIYPINPKEDEGVVYTTKLTLPAEREEKSYIVTTDVVAEAYEMVVAGDLTYAVLTPIEMNMGGNVRAYEMYPWVERSGRFGFWPVVVGMEGNPRSMGPYLVKVQDIAENMGKWVRRVKDVTLPAPPGSVWSDPKWPKELLDGNLDSLILRAYRGLIIDSLESDEAKWLAGIYSI